MENIMMLPGDLGLSKSEQNEEMMMSRKESGLDYSIKDTYMTEKFEISIRCTSRVVLLKTLRPKQNV